MNIKVKLYMKSGSVINCLYKTDNFSYADILKELYPDKFNGTHIMTFKMPDDRINGNIFVVMNDVEAVELYQ